MPDKHFTYGGSNAHIWFYCDGSAQLSRMVPQVEAGESAKRGTRIHDLACKIYNKDVIIGNLDEINIANKYVKDCLEIAPAVHMEELYSRNDEFGGTVDGWTLKDNVLYVWDLKTGKSKVSAKNNEQLLFYTFLLDICLPEIESFKLGIYQNEKFDWWELSLEEMTNWFTFIQKRIEHLRYQPLTLTKGSHCLWCKAKHVCWEYNKDKPTETIMKIDTSSF